MGLHKDGGGIIHVGIGDFDEGTTNAEAAMAAAAGITVTVGGGSRDLLRAFLVGVRASRLSSLLESERLIFLVKNKNMILAKSSLLSMLS